MLIVMSSKSQNDRGTKATIFVVDDEVILLDLAKTILQPLGFEVLTFNDPKAALEAFVKSRPELIVTDYAMGDLTGLELLCECRRINPQQKVILVSGTVDERIFSDGKIKPDGFLSKPYQIGDLIQAVRALVKG